MKKLIIFLFSFYKLCELIKIQAYALLMSTTVGGVFLFFLIVVENFRSQIVGNSIGFTHLEMHLPVQWGALYFKSI